MTLGNGVMFSQKVMLELTNRGFSRDKAYAIVQKHAHKNEGITFAESLYKDKMVTKKISIEVLKKMFETNYYIKKIDIIFKRVFK